MNENQIYDVIWVHHFHTGTWLIVPHWFEIFSGLEWQKYCPSARTSHCILAEQVSEKLELNSIEFGDSVFIAKIGLAKKSPKVLRTNDAKNRDSNFIVWNSIDTTKKSKTKDSNESFVF